jgi:hypothetical protein
MAFDVGIHVWFDRPDEADWAGLALECLRAGLSPISAVSRPDFDVRLRLCRRSENYVVWEATIRSADAFRMAAADFPAVARDSLFQADLAFPCALYSAGQRQIEEAVHPLSIRLAGPEFDVDGYEHKRNGLVRFSFSNVKVFGVPSELVGDTRAAVATGEQDRYLRMISRISRNYDVVLDVARRTVEHLDPGHLLICTELEVHPLTAHGLYHRRIDDFLEDLGWIADLHEEGGLYLCSGCGYHLMPPRRESGDYGYLRAQQGSTADLLSKLEPRLRRWKSSAGRSRLSADDIRIALGSGPARTVEAMRGSILVSADDAPFKYLEAPFFDLFDLASAAADAHVH